MLENKHTNCTTSSRFTVILFCEMRAVLVHASPRGARVGAPPARGAGRAAVSAASPGTPRPGQRPPLAHPLIALAAPSAAPPRRAACFRALPQRAAPRSTAPPGAHDPVSANQTLRTAGHKRLGAEPHPCAPLRPPADRHPACRGGAGRSSQPPAGSRVTRPLRAAELSLASPRLAPPKNESKIPNCSHC